MNLYPKIVVGERLVSPYLRTIEETNGWIYFCETVELVRQAVSELILLNSYPDEIYFYFEKPRRILFNPLLKFMEETQLKLVFLVKHDCIPATIISRTGTFEKDEEPTFKGPLESLRVSKSMLAKLYILFDEDRSK